MRYKWAWVVGGGLAATLATAAAIAANGGFSLINNNDRYAIDKMWIAEVDDEDWSAMTMRYPIKAGIQSGFALKGLQQCMIDIRVKLSDGSMQEFDDLDACKDPLITVQ